MKRIILPLVTVLAVILGALLPKGFLYAQDRHLLAPISYSVEEPMLQYGEVPTGGTAAVFGLDNSSDAIAWRLSCFQAGAPTVVPLQSTQTGIWAKRAIMFLSAVCEVSVKINVLEAVYRLALFGDGTAVPFWLIYAEFNDHWQCTMAIDVVSGIILSFELHSGSADLSALFPISFEQGAVTPGTDFEALATRRFTDALGDFMAPFGSVQPGPEPDTVTVHFADTPELQLSLLFTLDLMEGIVFNNPTQFYLW